MIRLFKTPYVFRWIFPRRIWGFSSSNTIYLTFDDGPTEGLTKWILQLLEEKDVKATFFCVGANAKKHPELLEEIRSHGHAIGNHTMHHERGTKIGKKQYLESIEETNAYTNSQLFRPPHGRLPITYDKTIRAKYKIVMWSWLSYDFNSSVSIEKILDKANKQIRPGDIVVVHDNAKVEERLKEILPQLINLLYKKGYTFEVISA
jgi:peptidoglycan-N-acetylglucosamine deacetylase